LVFEIWPRGHNSPIHNHGDSVAVIKVLDGEIESEWFNPIWEYTGEKAEVVKTGSCKSGEVTWMTPCFYQTHRLTNRNSKGAAITLQGYEHTWQSNPRDQYSESFNYIVDGDPALKFFYPKIDFYYSKLEEQLKNEYNTRSC